MVARQSQEISGHGCATNTRSYLWFEVGAGGSQFWSKKPLNAGRSVFDCRSLQVAMGAPRRPLFHTQPPFQLH